MKRHTFLICPDLYVRLKSEITAPDYMNRTFLIITRNADGTMCVIQHGSWGSPVGMSLTELRAYVMAHSNLTADESFDLISCYSGSFNKEELDENRIRYIDTVYPILYDIDDNECALVACEIENDEEAVAIVNDVVESFHSKGINVPEEAIERIMLLHNYMGATIEKDE